MLADMHVGGYFTPPSAPRYVREQGDDLSVGIASKDHLVIFPADFRVDFIVPVIFEFIVHFADNFVNLFVRYLIGLGLSISSRTVR